MRSFKKIVLMILVLFLLETFFSFCLEPVTYTYFLNYDRKEMKRAGQEPDVVLIGDSRIYRTFIPQILDEELAGGGHCTLNTGTGSQTVQESYFYLKDLLEQYPVKYAVVELSYNCFLEQSGSAAMGDWILYDRLSFWRNKISYLIQTVKPSSWINVLKSYRYRKNFPDIPSNIRTKLSKETREGIDTREGEHYEDRGFVWTDPVYEDGAIGLLQKAPKQWDRELLSKEAFDWLDRIRELCSQNGTQLILVTGPVSLGTIYSITNYDDSYACFSEYAERYGLPYFELNFLKGRRELLPDSMMRDNGHVCGEGARIVSTVFCEVLNGWLRGEDVSGRFYASAAQMKQEIGEVVACDFHTEAEENGTGNGRIIFAESIQEEGKEAEFEFWIRPETQDGEWVLLQEYGSSNTCLIPESYLTGDLSIRVNARLAGSGKAWESYMEKMREAGAGD